MTNDPQFKAILANWAERVVETAQRNLGATQNVTERNASGTRVKKRRRVASGNLKRSLMFYIKKGNGNTQIIFSAKGSAKDYADVIEQGRRPNSKPPPIEPIVRWMKEKPVRLQKPGGGFIKQTEQGIRSAAFLIARKIGKYGITGTHYFQEAVDQHKAELIDDIEGYLGFDLNND